MRDQRDPVDELAARRERAAPKLCGAESRHPDVPPMGPCELPAGHDGWHAQFDSEGNQRRGWAS